MGRKSHGRPGQGGKLPTKSGDEEMFRSLCVKHRSRRRSWRKCMQNCWTQNSCQSLAHACRGFGRLRRVGEVSDALGGRKGSPKTRLDKMHVSMPKATTDRTNGGRGLKARGERAVPLVRRPDDEAGAAPGEGEGNAEEGGDAAAAA
jgi:hypothetical protein